MLESMSDPRKWTETEKNHKGAETPRKWAAYNAETGETHHFDSVKELMDWHNTLGTWTFLPREVLYEYVDALTRDPDDDDDGDDDDDDEEDD